MSYSYYSFALVVLIFIPGTAIFPKKKDLEINQNLYSQTNCDHTSLPSRSFRLIYHSKNLESGFFVRGGVRVGRFNDAIDVWNRTGKYLGRFALPVDLISGVSAYHRHDNKFRPGSDGRLQLKLELVPKIKICDGWLTKVFNRTDLLDRGIVMERAK